MSDIQSFLSWFEGFSENIDKTPNGKQWERLKAKVAELTTDNPAALKAAREADAMTPAPVPKKPKNAKEWRASYEAALIELGLDKESAVDFATDVEPDLKADPVAVASQNVGPFLRN